MKPISFLPALAATLVVAACGTADPTAPAVDRLEPEASLDQREFIGSPHDPTICAKLVPASENAENEDGPRILLKRHREGDCPPGFDDPLGAG